MARFVPTPDAVPEQRVYFSQAQLALLEKVFPEIVASSTTTEEELRHAGGYRAVVRYVRTWTK